MTHSSGRGGAGLSQHSTFHLELEAVEELASPGGEQEEGHSKSERFVLIGRQKEGPHGEGATGGERKGHGERARERGIWRGFQKLRKKWLSGMGRGFALLSRKRFPPLNMKRS